MFFKFLFFTCFFCFLGFSAEPGTGFEGEGRFIYEEGDSLPFIKEQLLFSSFQDVITKYLNIQGLNSNLFWEKYNQKFDNYFKSFEKDLRNGYSASDLTSPDNIKKLEKEIRFKKLERKVQFGMLNRAIRSYSINSMTRSPNMPQARFINITAQVDTNLLNRIYFDYVSQKNEMKGSKLYILSLFSLENMSWSDTGVGTMKDFASVVSDHWKKYLDTKLKQQFTEIVLLEENSQSELNNFFEGANPTNGFLNLTESGRGRFSGIDDGFLLMINIKMRKISEKILLKKSEIEFEISYILVDMVGNKVISSFDFSKETNSFSTENLNQLSSSIASLVYRIPLSEFGKIKKNITDNYRNRNIVFLKVKTLRSIEDLINIQEILKRRGVSFQIDSKITTIKASEGILELEFSGNQSQAEQFLREMEKERLSDGREFVFEQTGSEYALEIKSLFVEKNVIAPNQIKTNDNKNNLNI